MDADRRVLERNGITVGTELSGCCGLAGNFGAERGHEEVSRKVAELALLPALEEAAAETPILADGFSCRTQIQALSGRRARHLAEVLAERLPPPRAADGRGSARGGGWPRRQRRPPTRTSTKPTANPR